jgi:16S rRNA (cytosine967-C5)-methyltransferase
MAARPGVAVRVEAATAIAAVRSGGRSLRAALAEVLPRLADARDRALCEAIVFAACRWLPRYEAVLAQLLDKALPARHARIHALLLAGLAQLDALQLPAHASLDATAEAARTLRAPALVGLVNALLRRFLREGAALLQRLAHEDPVVASAHPVWLLERLQHDWPRHWPAIVEANNRQAPLWLRVHAQRVGREAYRQRLAAAGIAAEPLAHWPQALRLDAAPAPTSLPGWDAGLVAVQDAAAQIVPALLALAPGQRVLDACAAPGGKTAALLEAEPALRLLALDNAPARLARLRSGLARLGHAPAMQCADAARPQDWWDGQPFDRILLDVPCSATGIIRRQPDVKWHRRAADIPALAAQQAILLDALWPLLAPGGQLLYTTCSVLTEENAGSVAGFLARTPDARPLALPDWLGHAAGPGRQRLPGEAGMDGFYYALLGKD